MTRIEKILSSARITLADKNKERWSDDDLLTILSEGHKDLCRHTQILHGRFDIIPVIDQQYYTLPDDVWMLTRVTYDNRVLPLVSHPYLDAMTTEHVYSDSQVSISGYHWEADRGSPLAILYDRRNVNEFKVYPIPDESIFNTVYDFDSSPIDYYGDGVYGVVTEIDNYTFNSDYGVVVELFDSYIEEEIENSLYGVTANILENEAKFKCYYIKVAPDLETVNDDLLTPPMFDTALKYYVVGHAFMNDLNQEYQAKGTQQLGFYDRELQLARSTARRDATAASQYSTPYRGAF